MMTDIILLLAIGCVLTERLMTMDLEKRIKKLEDKETQNETDRN